MVIFLPFSPMTVDFVLVPRNQVVRIYRYRHFFWAIGLLALGTLLLRGLAGAIGPFAEGAAALPFPAGSTDPFWLWLTLGSGAFLAFLFWSGYVPYVMTPPEGQQILSAEEGDELLDPDTHVLGLFHNEETRAYPRSLLARPHYLHDELGGHPVTVSYCILCNSGIAFEAELDGRPLNLRALTATNNNIIFFEPERGNFIQQLDGRIFAGPDEGRELQALPLLLTTWAEWKALHPETRVRFAPPRTLRDRMVNWMLQKLIPLEKLTRRRSPWHRLEAPVDDRLPAMSFVLGVEQGGERRAYPVDIAKKKGVIQDTLGGEPLVVLYDAASDVGSVFSRRLDAQTLRFEPYRLEQEGIVARDLETGSLWDIHGRAREGGLAGRNLTELPHFNKLFWFAWAHFKPDTKVFAETQPAEQRKAA
ncbi:DUF3179 domain-containing (seleno)protein [Thiohalorhabdus sp. Cl-TMA]|uniref:DUF3179 domain-containing (seleno)protein n=1 Tax=Thiohalorhabdus methylotrophus TaxID=3242694 RepID=UPI00359F7745